LPIVRQYLEWFIRSEEIVVIIYRFTPALPGRYAGKLRSPFPYNKVTDENTPPAGAGRLSRRQVRHADQKRKPPDQDKTSIL
jgi:hypothetical protein